MERIYQIALNLLPGVGSITARHLLDYAGSASDIFKMRTVDLIEIKSLGQKAASRIYEHLHDASLLRRAENELRLCEEKGIQILFYKQEGYPSRLLACEDAPVLLFVKGRADLDQARMISVVGTRKATDYGNSLCQKLIRDLAPYRIAIISGLALGIDTVAHAESLRNELPTVAVLGHGLGHCYPSSNLHLARKIAEEGALVTEFLFDQKAEKENFPKRNRIIAGLTDATVVVEAAETGGALITAGIASSYSREVFAFPGRTSDPYSQGCLAMIKNQQAALITGADDLLHLMSWEKSGNSETIKQAKLILDPMEQQVLNFIVSKQLAGLAEIGSEFRLLSHKLPAVLLQLELKGMIRQLPGKRFEGA